MNFVTSTQKWRQAQGSKVSRCPIPLEGRIGSWWALRLPFHLLQALIPTTTSDSQG